MSDSSNKKTGLFFYIHCEDNHMEDETAFRVSEIPYDPKQLPDDEVFTGFNTFRKKEDADAILNAILKLLSNCK